MTLPTKTYATQDYIDAVRNPALSFNDPYLKQGHPATTKLKSGQNRLITSSGSFAITIKYLVGNEIWAIRCFKDEKLPTDLEARYHQVTQFIANNKTQFLVDIEYQPQGLRVLGVPRPICKMQWVEGKPLNEYLAIHKNQPERLAALPEKFLNVVMGMAQLGCAHGDLQHGNILMAGDEMVLIDYDGMYVPAYGGSGRRAPENGHRNYQHPQRTAAFFNAQIDRFSAISIYLSLCAIRRDNSLIVLNAKNENEAEHLFLRETDYKAPQQSAQMLKLAALGYQDAVAQFVQYCLGKFDAVPSLHEFLLACPTLLAELPSVTQERLRDENANWVTTTTSTGIARAALTNVPSVVSLPASARITPDPISVKLPTSYGVPSTFALPQTVMPNTPTQPYTPSPATSPTSGAPAPVPSVVGPPRGLTWRRPVAILVLIVLGIAGYRASIGTPFPLPFLGSAQPTATTNISYFYSTDVPSRTPYRSATPYPSNTPEYVSSTPNYTLTPTETMRQSNASTVVSDSVFGKLISGPSQGVLVHKENVIASDYADISVRDFTARATFTIPSTSHAVDYGFLFRYTSKTNFYELTCTWNQQWILTKRDESSSGSTVSRGSLASLWNSEAGDTNTILLKADGIHGYLYVNDTYVTSLDLSAITDAGYVMAASGMFSDSISPGLRVSYNNFMVYAVTNNVGTLSAPTYVSATPTYESTTVNKAYLFKGTVYSDNRINVRSGPSVGNNIIGGLEPNESVLVLEVSTDQNWYRIQFSGSTSAWVSASLISGNIFGQSQQFTVVDLREKLGKVIKETTSDVDNSQGATDLITNINFKKQYRHKIELKLNQNSRLIEKDVKDRIYDTYDISSPSGETSCVFPAEVPAGRIYAYDIEWTEITREGNIQAKGGTDQGDILGTYTVLVDLQCQVVGAEVKQ